MSTLGKLFTRVLNNRLNFWSDTHSVLIDAQGGFRSGRSTVDSIFILHGLINNCLNNSKKLYCAFVDFRKAFDYIRRDCLWYKLLQNGISGNMYDIIRNMYESVVSKVKINGELSESFECYIGVRQGECLSPFLFSIYINDLEKEFIEKGMKGITISDFKMFLLLYADDAVIFSETQEDLQHGIYILHDYCKRWRLEVNIQKTKIVVFRKGGRLSHDDHWFYGDQRL